MHTNTNDLSHTKHPTLRHSARTTAAADCDGDDVVSGRYVFRVHFLQNNAEHNTTHDDDDDNDGDQDETETTSSYDVVGIAIFYSIGICGEWCGVLYIWRSSLGWACFAILLCFLDVDAAASPPYRVSRYVMLCTSRAVCVMCSSRSFVVVVGVKSLCFSLRAEKPLGGWLCGSYQRNNVAVNNAAEMGADMFAGEVGGLYVSCIQYTLRRIEIELF